MEINNIIDSINHVEFLNKIDNLIFKLLFDEKEGYYNLRSKEAIEENEYYIEKFNQETENLLSDYKVADVTNLINEKRNEYILKLKEHFFRQSDIWADEVYLNLIENCIFMAKINKNDKNALDKIYHRGLSAISWISSIKNFEQKSKQNILDTFQNDFLKAVNSKEENLNNKQTKTDFTTFLKLYFMPYENEEEFLKTELSDFQDKLNEKDITFLSTIKNKFSTYKKNEIKDEIALIFAAIEISKQKEEKSKYNFINEINNDFKAFYTQNKKLDENDKITLVKKRIEVFKNSAEKYYKKTLSESTFSSGE